MWSEKDIDTAGRGGGDDLKGGGISRGEGRKRRTAEFGEEGGEKLARTWRQRERQKEKREGGKG